ncbi:hypothetical protein HN020_18080 [Brevibacillus borstelensis]|jgi:two-component SAPR family response regulator|uniref:hypothetical protein n=1 Tax=Brevibacillus borstelensis TaxID=45462 RepID=UPI00148FD0D8|nr:hypothetical protein [Brevibacillus borstelensis]NOU56620.1 hypothetical protein [Brevibacillus borstelensis]
MSKATIRSPESFSSLLYKRLLFCEKSNNSVEKHLTRLYNSFNDNFSIYSHNEKYAQNSRRKGRWLPLSQKESAYIGAAAD